MVKTLKPSYSGRLSALRRYFQTLVETGWLLPFNFSLFSSYLMDKNVKLPKKLISTRNGLQSSFLVVKIHNNFVGLQHPEYKQSCIIFLLFYEWLYWVNDILEVKFPLGMERITFLNKKKQENKKNTTYLIQTLNHYLSSPLAW